MQYQYRALDSSGFVQTGVLDSRTELEALALLEERGMTPIELKSQSGAGNQIPRSGTQQIKQTDIVALVRELSTLLCSGVGLSDAFPTLLEATTHVGMRNALSNMNSSVRGGEGFSTALEKSGLELPPYVHALSKAGEATGDLGGSLARCADQLEFDVRMREEAKEALTYPSILVFTGVVAIVFIFSFVVPRFAGMLQGRSVDLPLLSRWVLGTGLFVREHWEVTVLAVMGLVAGGFLGYRRTWVRARMTRFFSKTPVLSAWVAGGETARWTSMLSVLLQSRVPILMCIDLAASSVQLPENVTRLKKVGDDVRRGKRFSSAIEEQRLLEGTSLTMLKVGEKSGQLGSMLGYVAEYTIDKHRALQRKLVALIEPVSILVIGLSLGVIMVGVVMAMTSLTEIKL